ncbi:MAG: CCA tRNA nucleotidyltransferase [Peptostreptococcaceae bacterium]
MIIPEKVNYILDKINENKFESFIVGGCVRDSLLGYTPNDYDITTSAKPNDLINIFKEHKLILSGIKHGTVSVLVDEEIFEITTYRIENEYIDNRRPKDVIFSDDIYEDLKRRDFTINSMAYNKSRGIIDLFGGGDDLNKKIIKTVGDPNERFNEDALRMIRCIRFSAKLGFKIEEKTLSSIYENSHLIKNISIERITDEFDKILKSDNVDRLKILFDTNILKNIELNFSDFNFDELLKLNRVKNLDDRIILFGYLTKDINVLEKLKYSKKTMDNIQKSIHIKEKLKENINKYEIKFILKDFGYERVYNTLNIFKDYYKFDLSKCEQYTYLLSILEDIKESDECYNLDKLQIKGTELIKLGYNGKDVGNKLRYLLHIVIKNNELNKKEILINLLENSSKSSDDKDYQHR